MSSDVELNEIGVLKRREIEARLLAPIVDALGNKFGRHEVLEVVRDVVTGIARRQGRELATRLGSNDLKAYGTSVEPWSRNDALQLHILDQNDSVLNFDVTKCRYAELYRSLGIEELGGILSWVATQALSRVSTARSPSNGNTRSFRDSRRAISASASDRRPLNRQTRNETAWSSCQTAGRINSPVIFSRPCGTLRAVKFYPGLASWATLSPSLRD